MAQRRWLHVFFFGVAGCVGFACAQGSGLGVAPGGVGELADAGLVVHDAGTLLDSTVAAPDSSSGAPTGGEPSLDAGDDDAPGAIDSATSDALSNAGSQDAAPVPDDDSAAPAGDGAVACSGGKIACGGACVDPTSDPHNCGACGTVCTSGVCGETIAADMSAQPSNLNFNGAATWSSAGPSAQMTAANAPGLAGTVVYSHPIVTDSFSAVFQFRIGAGGSGGRYDGMGFMLEVTGATAVGSANSMLGMGNLGGYGVEFDVYDNKECGDVSDDQIGIDLLEPCMTSMPTSIFASPDLTGTIDIADGQWHATTVSLSSGAMSVTVDGNTIASSVSLTGFVPGTSYYFGFSGGTGGIAPNGGVQTEARDVSISFPTPRCL